MKQEARSKAKAYVPPTQVTVDPSCADVPAASDPSVQRTAIGALQRSLRNEATGKAEHGFYASENIFGDGYSVGPLFTSGAQRRIDYDLVSRMRPSLPESILGGTYRPELFVHTHPNNAPPSPTDDADGHVAQQLGIPVAAIDRGGNLTCTWKPSPKIPRK